MRLMMILLLFPAFLFGQKESLTEVDRFGSNPGHLRLLMHTSSKIVEDSVPLVVVLHGCSQNAEGVARLTGWNKLADSLGFFVLYPQTRTVNNPSKCFNWFSEKHNQRDKGEARSIRAQVNYMERSFPIDPNRVFVVGMSAGAAMAVNMLACYPEVFSAGACIAGGPYGGARDVWDSGKIMIGSVAKTAKEWESLVRVQNPEFTGAYPRLVVWHGTSDPVVNVNNADELVKQWITLHDFTAKADSMNYSFQENERISRFSWIKEGTEMLIDYRVQGFGHRLLVNPGPQGGKTGLFGLDIEIHSTYWIAKDFGLTP